MRTQLPANRWLELFRKSPEDLKPREAAELADALGPAALWILNEEAIRRLAEEAPWCVSAPPPELSPEAGCCGIVYAAEKEFPLLENAFVLPVQWCEGPAADRFLPERLRDLAARVVRHLHPKRAWSLHRFSPFDEIDLSPLDGMLQHESGWVSLAGGLHIADRGGKPRPKVWATGCWDGDGGIVEPGGIEVKLALARKRGVEEFFVPEELAPRLPQERPRIGRLRTGLLSPADALQDYLAALDAPPGPNAERDLRIEYYLRQREGHPKTREYYRENLLPEVVRERRRQMEKEEPGWSPTHLVTVVSGSPELIHLAVRVLQAEQCLLLYIESENGDEINNRMRNTALDLAAELNGAKDLKIKAECKAFPENERMAEVMWQHITSFAGGTPDGRLVFDVTPGSKLMTLALEYLARTFRPESSLLYVSKKMDGNRLVPLSERLSRWQASLPAGPFAPAGG
jgi:hypothetical protein